MNEVTNTKPNYFLKESFLEVTVENFKDYVANMLHYMQMYSDFYTKRVSIIYKETLNKNRQKDESYDFVNFLSGEMENIFRFKCFDFISQANKLLKMKYETLRDGIKSYESGDTLYIYSNRGLNYLQSEIKSINFAEKTGYSYSERKKDMADTFDFNGWLNKEIKKLEDEHFEQEVIFANTNQLLNIIDSTFVRLIKAIRDLKNVTEMTMSSYISALLVKDCISLLATTYYAVLNIKFVTKDNIDIFRANEYHDDNMPE